jgi:hypothetical protein
MYCMYMYDEYALKGLFKGFNLISFKVHIYLIPEVIFELCYLI